MRQTRASHSPVKGPIYHGQHRMDISTSDAPEQRQGVGRQLSWAGPRPLPGFQTAIRETYGISDPIAY